MVKELRIFELEFLHCIRLLTSFRLHRLDFSSFVLQKVYCVKRNEVWGFMYHKIIYLLYIHIYMYLPFVGVIFVVLSMLVRSIFFYQKNNYWTLAENNNKIHLSKKIDGSQQDFVINTLNFFGVKSFGHKNIHVKKSFTFTIFLKRIKRLLLILLPELLRRLQNNFIFLSELEIHSYIYIPRKERWRKRETIPF
jgi:hypothetical protein